MSEEECGHKLKPLKQESSHEGACYHVGSCLIDAFYCEKCGATITPSAQTVTFTNGTILEEGA